jgi:putative NADPH-quinone reductase
MPACPLVLLASARPAGHTAALVHSTLAPSNYVVLDLLAAPLAPYSYAATYPADDAFGSVVQQMLRHEVLVLATPVYWYAMSGLLKTFFDRLTDLVTTEKALGRQLRGKRLFVLASGTEATLPPGFEEPFRRTAHYFAMTFGGSLYYSQHHPLPPAEWAAASQAFCARLAPTT